MANGKLGFGCMRLPVIGGDANKIDIAEFSKMADLFLDRGFTYFDTSAVYHGGFSEQAVREAVVKRHPRERFTVATKFPTFIFNGSESRGQIEATFQGQLDNCGVDYFDYYLLHNLNEVRYEDICKPLGLFEFIQEKKAAGIIKHIGFSFHDSAEVLDKILFEHPEIEFVQIVVNYFDWNSYVIQSRDCYEVIRRHGKQVVIMETVKGGMLAKLPEEAEDKLKAAKPNASAASWAVRFAAGLDGVLAVLSGVSSIEQVEDNTACMRDFTPLSAEETALVMETAKLIRRSGPARTEDFKKFEDVNQPGVPAAALLDTWNSMALQPDPYFGAEGNYYGLLRQRHSAPIRDGLTAADGTDITALVRKADAYVQEHAF